MTPDPARTANPPLSKPPVQLEGVQHLRAIAALMVAYFHTIDQVPLFSQYFKHYLLGQLNLATGVDVFFVISGFIMLISSRNARPGTFMLRRIIRIVPLYWSLTLLLVVLALIAPAQFRTTVVSLANIVRSLLFIPYVSAGHPGEVFPLLVPGWSLNLEMFFYVIFSGALFAPARYRLWLVGAVLGTLVAIGFLAREGAIPAPLRFYTDIRLIEFWLGMLIAHLSLQRVPQLPRKLSMVLLLLAFAMLLTGYPASAWHLYGILQPFSETVIPAALIVYCVVSLESSGGLFKSRLLAWLGDASYSLYLSHIFSLGLARLIWARLGLERDDLFLAAGFGIFGMVLIIVGTWFTYVAIEKPSLAVLQRLIKRPRPATPA